MLKKLIELLEAQRAEAQTYIDRVTMRETLNYYEKVQLMYKTAELSSKSLLVFDSEDYELPKGLDEYSFMITLYKICIEHVLCEEVPKSTSETAIMEYRAERQYYINRSKLIYESLLSKGEIKHEDKILFNLTWRLH